MTNYLSSNLQARNSNTNNMTIDNSINHSEFPKIILVLFQRSIPFAMIGTTALFFTSGAHPPCRSFSRKIPVALCANQRRFYVLFIRRPVAVVAQIHDLVILKPFAPSTHVAKITTIRLISRITNIVAFAKIVKGPGWYTFEKTGRATSFA